MNKTAVADIDSHVGNVIRSIVRFGEKDQVARFQCIAVQNNLTIPGLVLRTMGQRDFMGRERHVGQSRTIQTPGSGASHAVRSAHELFSRADHLAGFGTSGVQPLSGAAAYKCLHLSVGNYR